MTIVDDVLEAIPEVEALAKETVLTRRDITVAAMRAEERKRREESATIRKDMKRRFAPWINY